MKRILLTILFVLISSVVFAGDFDISTVTLSFAADSSDSGVIYDSTYSDVLNIAGWSGISWNWYISDEANYTNDTIFIYLETYMTNEFTKPIKPVAVNAVDTILIGANDTVGYAKNVLPKDSLHNYVRFLAIHAITPGATVAVDSVGVERNWIIKYYCEDINR